MLPQPVPVYSQQGYVQQSYSQNVHKPMSVPVNQYPNSHGFNSNTVAYTHIHAN